MDEPGDSTSSLEDELGDLVTTGPLGAATGALGHETPSAASSAANLTHRSKVSKKYGQSASRATTLVARPIPMPKRLDILEAFLDKKYGCHSVS